MKRTRRRSRFVLVALGVTLGYAARLMLGPPTAELENENRFSDPLPQEPVDHVDSEIMVLPSHPVRLDSATVIEGIQPKMVRTWEPRPKTPHLNLHEIPNKETPVVGRPANAMFEPHGHEICASGCALSHHPTEALSRQHYLSLLRRFSNQPMDNSSDALEELLFYGAQTAQFMATEGLEFLDEVRIQFLTNCLRQTHARVSLRVIDDQGDIRTWLLPTRVPLDRRHVFQMETKNLQPLVTSGTVKRVGLDHLWVRL